jgi:ArsR family transcriptional regulator
VENMASGCCKNKKANKELGKTAEFLKVIAEENRLKILCLLQKQEMCVCEIQEYFALSQNLISHHLKILRDFGLVNFKKEGTKVIYSLNSKTLKEYYSLLSHYIQQKSK